LHGNLLEVRNIFKDNEDSNIQKILRLQWISNKLINNVLGAAIDFYNTHGQKEGIEIIELIWQKADQNTCDFICSTEYNLAEGGNVSTINMLRQGRTNDSNKDILEAVIQEMEECKRVIGLDYKLREAIKNLDVDQVKAALESCGKDVKSVLERKVYWHGTGNVDALLVCPLKVKYSEKLDQEDVEKIKEITKLLWNGASSNVRDFWLKDNMVDERGQSTGDNYIIAAIKGQQEFYVEEGIADEEWLGDFIQEVKDYKKSREEELSKRVEDIEEKEPIADNETPGNSDTTFWSKHKGKIALDATVVCTAGAIAAYVLAYPAVALALTALAAVILMGAGIAKVLEDPSVEGLSTSKGQGA
jgi:hypothetical protein